MKRFRTGRTWWSRCSWILSRLGFKTKVRDHSIHPACHKPRPPNTALNIASGNLQVPNRKITQNLAHSLSVTLTQAAPEAQTYSQARNQSNPTTRNSLESPQGPIPKPSQEIPICHNVHERKGHCALKGHPSSESDPYTASLARFKLGCVALDSMPLTTSLDAPKHHRKSTSPN